MFLHLIFGDMFAKQSIVAFLQSGNMIPDDARNINLILQAEIPLGAIQTILVGFADFNYAWHSFNPIMVGESVGVSAPRLTPQTLTHLFENYKPYASYPHR